MDSDGFTKIDSTKKKNPQKSQKYENNNYNRDNREKGGYKKPYNKQNKKQYKNDENKVNPNLNQIGIRGEITSSEMADGLSREPFEEIDNKNENTTETKQNIKISTETKPVEKTAKVITNKKNLKDMFG